MRYPLKKKLRAYYRKRLLAALFQTVIWCAAWVAAIEFFYGPGVELVDSSPYLVGGLSALGMVGVLVSFCFLLVRLAGFLSLTGGLRRSMMRYLPEGSSLRDPYALLDEDIRCQVLESVDIYLGCDWVLFAGRAMRRDAITGIFYEDLSKSYLSRKFRLQLADDKGRTMILDLRSKQSPAWVHRLLVNLHPRVVHGDARAKEGLGAISAYQLSQKVRQTEVYAPLGFSRWDKSPILEDNHIRWDYERWLLASYSLYLATDPYHNGDLAFAGGYERTVHQRSVALEVLGDPWEIRTKEELLDTVRHLIRTGRTHRDGWQLGRATMVLGFGYAGELISREELLEQSLDAALAIQQTFSSWQALFESHMVGFAAWAKKSAALRHRRQALRELLADPGSPVNTVPFQMDLPSLYQEAMEGLRNL